VADCGNGRALGHLCGRRDPFGSW